MSEHSPGPWHVDGRQIKCVDHGRYYRIATGYNPMFTAAANEANARLMATAPELLEGLQAVLQILRDGNQVDSIHDAHWIEMLIEKATGRTL